MVLRQHDRTVKVVALTRSLVVGIVRLADLFACPACNRRGRVRLLLTSMATLSWLGGTYFFSHAGQHDEERHKDGDEDDAECDGGHIASHGRSVCAVVERRSTVVTKRIEPAFHFLMHNFFRRHVYLEVFLILHKVERLRLLACQPAARNENAKN